MWVRGPHRAECPPRRVDRWVLLTIIVKERSQHVEVDVEVERAGRPGLSQRMRFPTHVEAADPMNICATL